MTPLDLIKNWFDSQSLEHQYEIAALSGHFHLDERIDTAFGEEPKLKLFKEYLETDELNNKEIIRRTLFITCLLDFSFDGRNTENGWTETLDRFLSLRTHLKEEGRDTRFVDEQLDKFNERKNAWLEICESWEKLKNNSLTNRQIADWYFFKTRK